MHISPVVFFFSNLFCGISCNLYDSNTACVRFWCIYDSKVGAIWFPIVADFIVVVLTPFGGTQNDTFWNVFFLSLNIWISSYDLTRAAHDRRDDQWRPFDSQQVRKATTRNVPRFGTLQVLCTDKVMQTFWNDLFYRLQNIKSTKLLRMSMSNKVRRSYSLSKTCGNVHQLIKMNKCGCLSLFFFFFFTVTIIQ